ncbi:spermidine synthase [Calderihabitans maritimus]|uniref:Polyamine aminopropyltransferase n=1 Tax=Calderihabitans maritimus TaxID=1246530 RepID=A0A1Z5HV40_9FIRM|nr:polyamine aminopropyltransferase [Calderihabitans maritimus]GAW93382.1 spermidine synthase [Calderihabitans maritimus]
MKGLWFSELQTSTLKISCMTKSVLCSEQSQYQNVAVLDTLPYGRMLVLDDVIQTTVKDEFIYHEMISLVALNTHPFPRNVLIIGGGDGGTLREVTRHPAVEKATLVEIDEKVIEASRKYLPQIGSAFDDPKAEIVVADGIKHVQEHENEYDVIIIDSTDPVGPAVGLFSEDFYRQVHRALKDDGILVAQTESPFFNEELVSSVYKSLKKIFAISKVYLATVPSYPGGLWCFTMGSKKYDPEQVDLEKIPPLNTRYYNPQIHKAAFVLPNFIAELLK